MEVELEGDEAEQTASPLVHPHPPHISFSAPSLHSSSPAVGPTALASHRSSLFIPSDPTTTTQIPPRSKSNSDLVNLEKYTSEGVVPEKTLSPPFSVGNIRQSADRSLTGSGSSTSAEPEEVLKSGWLTKQDKSKEVF